MIRPRVVAQVKVPFYRRATTFLIMFALAAAGIVAYQIYSGNFSNQAGATISMPWRGSNPAEKRTVSDLEFPAKLVIHVAAGSPDGFAGGPSRDDPSGLSLKQPSDAVSIGNRFYVLDSGNGRVVELDASGKALRPLDASLDRQLALREPMALAVHAGNLYIADSGSRRVVIVRPSDGHVEEIAVVRNLVGDTEVPRPVGIAVTMNGEVFLSDASNQRIVRVGPDGTVSNFAGTGKRAYGNFGLNSPGGLSLDRQGNVYVVDILNSRVMKYSPGGEFLLQIGRQGDTAGTFSRPKGVAVDDHGDVFVTDSLGGAVEVFDPHGKYLGLIGRKESGNRDSESLFSAPAGLKIVDGKLEVTDRVGGLFVFDLN